MPARYFKKFWDETSGDELTDSWGTATYYFETDEALNVLKQIEWYQNGNILKYDEQNIEDAFGGLADQPLDIDEFTGNEIPASEFFTIWAQPV